MPDNADEIKRAAQQIGEAASSGDLDRLDDVLAEDVVAHFPGQDSVRGRETYKETLRTYRRAFPDFAVKDHDVVAEGDTVARRFTVRGTHDGDFMGIDPTGNSVEGSGMNIARFDNGKVVEEITCADMLGLMQQLGVIELPGE